MTGIGNSRQVASLSNCFVIGSEDSADSYGSIMKIDQEQVQLMKRRGGVGHDLSAIRPHGTPVKNINIRSNPIPQPPCGADPESRKSTYHCKGFISMLRFFISVSKY